MSAIRPSVGCYMLTCRQKFQGIGALSTLCSILMALPTVSLRKLMPQRVHTHETATKSSSTSLSGCLCGTPGTKKRQFAWGQRHRPYGYPNFQLKDLTRLVSEVAGRTEERIPSSTRQS
ncbi:hypothetical protein PHLGIDRAFT_366378 [Phlebiopsis gigantea 11061_1 CR5-6]|uniref:Uncharacterized protein n=1 Tax=Phlebiopsis gigantea (strain 11061_1 CR5-6) TaxID=745531 RepID=A0A0C3SCB6_PHLG1|nr:hypothetical protein PHLGIDRAFT_366378 [Phlebiopsis gigantea 11061_1 CR5-6]